MKRVRKRDLQTSNNKCFSIFFDNDKPKSRKSKSRSPRKKNQQKDDFNNLRYSDTTFDSYSKENQITTSKISVKKKLSDNNIK